MDCAWIGVGSVIPIPEIATRVASPRGMPWKVALAAANFSAGTSTTLGDSFCRVSARAGEPRWFWKQGRQ